MSPKMGRPTDNPKPFKITVRLDAKSKEVLERYSKERGVDRGEVVRMALKQLDEK